ncbi:hypothetical protein XELAEV_18035624mg [Xenopus laevis]|uniref:Uncharacterized protein n=1 Tax=Xenopus laevis TaxID=8355 RepID=A0A974CI85_XENLA|nr:hypothetical protein XELAEV_18035624mg [Xenopus laevis]
MFGVVVFFFVHTVKLNFVFTVLTALTVFMSLPELYCLRLVCYGNINAELFITMLLLK